MLFGSFIDGDVGPLLTSIEAVEINGSSSEYTGRNRFLKSMITGR